MSVPSWLEDFWEFVVTWWGFQITVIDERPITLGKLIMGLFLLVFGVWISKMLSRTIGKRVLIKIGMDKSAAGSFQTLLFYLLIIVFSMFTLELVNVPLTVFTLLGGAIAIGVGFGSQNLMNNFISGLILMAERPIKIGDLVQVGDLYGTVTSIGTRSTHVLTGTNVDILVPNSEFLEQKVVNWTLGDDRVRTHVVVGVAYGSPIREVKEVLLLAAKNHQQVLADPEPFVLFTDFGDSALVFEIQFWIRMKTQMDRKRIESDLRFSIDDLCNERQIVIAFPQRDVHLDTLKPLDIRLLGRPETEEKPTK